MGTSAVTDVMCAAPCKPHCKRLARSRGFCEAHYRRSLNGLELNSPIREQHPHGWEPPDGLCLAPCKPRCPRKPWCAGYCHAHYARLRDRGYRGLRTPIGPHGGYRKRKAV